MNQGIQSFANFQILNLKDFTAEFRIWQLCPAIYWSWGSLPVICLPSLFSAHPWCSNKLNKIEKIKIVFIPII